MNVKINKDLVNSDKFCNMPKTTQLLYFLFLINADVNRIIPNPKSIIQANGFGDDDYTLLKMKEFIGTNGIDVYIND